MSDYPTHRRSYDPQPTPVTDEQRRKISAWLTANHRVCPRCQASADKLKAVDLRMRLNAQSGEPIDTSDETEIATFRCTACGFDRGELPTELVW